MLNADDPVLREPPRLRRRPGSSGSPAIPPSRRWRPPGGRRGGRRGRGRTSSSATPGPAGPRSCRSTDAPVTLGGAALYNVENALAALALAPALGVPTAPRPRPWPRFRPTADELPGRTNLFRFGGATVLLDFVHNPHGMRAMAETVLRMPARRRLVVLGQAGDRDDASIRALARAARQMQPQRVVIKELTKYLRGREPGEVPRLIREELQAADPDLDIVEVEDELTAARVALEWCEEGDLLVLPVQAQRDEVFELLGALRDADWRPGRPLPSPAAGTSP